MVNQAGHDPARSLLTLATRQLPAERRGWGQAMAAELDQLQHSPSSPVVEGRLAACSTQGRVPSVLTRICEGVDISDGSSLEPARLYLPWSLAGSLCSACWLERVEGRRKGELVRKLLGEPRQQRSGIISALNAGECPMYCSPSSVL
jgi:hypothetical protein